jgi:protein-tyrosine phosphatase
VLDLHIHLLRNVDDGPVDIETSTQMIDLAAELGYDRLVATPHLLEPLADTYESLASERLGELLQHATTRGIELRRGYEVRLTPDIGRRLDSGEPITLAGSRTVLVELPFSGWPLYTEHALFDMLAAGFVPLLAHPERYEAAVEQPQRILDLHKQGVRMQLTAGSFAGLFGKSAKTLSEQLLRSDAVDVIASDAHSAGRRFASVTEGLAHAERLVGAARVRQLTVDNPRALLSDCTLPPSLIAKVIPESHEAPSRPWQRVRSFLPGR